VILLPEVRACWRGLTGHESPRRGDAVTRRRQEMNLGMVQESNGKGYRQGCQGSHLHVCPSPRNSLVAEGDIHLLGTFPGLCGQEDECPISSMPMSVHYIIILTWIYLYLHLILSRLYLDEIPIISRNDPYYILNLSLKGQYFKDLEQWELCGTLGVGLDYSPHGDAEHLHGD